MQLSKLLLCPHVSLQTCYGGGVLLPLGKFLPHPFLSPYAAPADGGVVGLKGAQVLSDYS